MIVKLPLDQIIIPQSLLPRIFGAKEPVIAQYKEAMEEGAEFPPIKVWKKGNEEYWIIDGVHRYMAQKRLGRKYIEAEIMELQDEVEFMAQAIKENAKHGLPLAPEDKKESARRLYLKNYSVKDIAKLFSVSERTVYRWIGDLKDEKQEKLRQKALQLRSQGYTQREIARELGIPQQTISDWLNSLPKIDNCQNSVNSEDLENTDKKSDTFGLKEDYEAWVIHLYKQGHSPEEIQKIIAEDEEGIELPIGTIKTWISFHQKDFEEYEETESSEYKLLDPDEIARKVMEGYEEEEEEPEKPKRNQPNVGRPREKTFDALEELETYAAEMQALTWRIVSKFGHDKALDILNQLSYQVEKNIFEDIKVSL